MMMMMMAALRTLRVCCEASWPLVRVSGLHTNVAVGLTVAARTAVLPSPRSFLSSKKLLLLQQASMGGRGALVLTGSSGANRLQVFLSHLTTPSIAPRHTAAGSKLPCDSGGLLPKPSLRHEPQHSPSPAPLQRPLRTATQRNANIWVESQPLSPFTAQFGCTRQTTLQSRGFCSTRDMKHNQDTSSAARGRQSRRNRRFVNGLFLLASAAAVSAASAYSYLLLRHRKGSVPSNATYVYNATTAISRSQMVELLKKGGQKKEKTNKVRAPWTPEDTRNAEEQKKKEQEQGEGLFDVLVIGGGSSGSAVALECCSRGLSCALVEAGDFASGTSSRSTKLLHGGVRYLQDAVLHLDVNKFKLVIEALEERAHMLHCAPFLCGAVPLAVPVYGWWVQLPYYYVGVKLYDLLGRIVCCGKPGVPDSFFMSRSVTAHFLPLLRSESLKGSLVYFDGQHDDSRMNLLIALTAATENYLQITEPLCGYSAQDAPEQHLSQARAALLWRRCLGFVTDLAGNLFMTTACQRQSTWRAAVIANYCEVKDLLKDVRTGNVLGALVHDKLKGDTFSVYAKVIVNCTGAFGDNIQRMSNSKSATMVRPSLGAHITLPSLYSPKQFGLVIPETADNRLLFVLPWESKTIAGTTDTPADLQALPRVSREDVDFIASEAASCLNVPKTGIVDDIQSSWGGLRPLAAEGDSDDTAQLSRSHVVRVDENGLISLLGGKWTTCRKIAEDVLAFVLKTHHDKVACVPSSITKNLLLIGSSPPLDYQSSITEECRRCPPKDMTSAIDSYKVIRRLVKQSYCSEAQVVEARGLGEPSSAATSIGDARTIEEVLTTRDESNAAPASEESGGRRPPTRRHERVALSEETISHLVSSYGYRALHVCTLAKEMDEEQRLTARKDHTIPKDLQVGDVSCRGDESGTVQVEGREADRGSISHADSATDVRRQSFFDVLHECYPFIRAEVSFACRYEMAQRVSDVLGRRLRLAFLDVKASHEVLDQVVKLMCAELHWGAEEEAEARREGLEYINSMTYG